jgi:hypothetical protein
LRSGVAASSEVNLNALQLAPERAAIEFIDGDRPYIRLRKSAK